MNATTPELLNLYQAAADRQLPAKAMREAATALGIAPTAHHNGLRLYRSEDIDCIEEHLRKGQAGGG